MINVAIAYTSVSTALNQKESVKAKDKLPTNYSIIDKIVQTLIDERKLLYEDQGYFEKFIKPDLENDNEDFPPEYYSGPFY